MKHELELTSLALSFHSGQHEGCHGASSRDASQKWYERNATSIHTSFNTFLSFCIRVNGWEHPQVTKQRFTLVALV